MPPLQGRSSGPTSSPWQVFAAVGLVMVLAAAGVALARSTTTTPRPATAEPPPSPWEVHLARAADTRVKWLMPSITGIDGPRSLRHIEAPAIGTFWVSLQDGDPLRYDATMLQDVGPVTSDPKALVVDAMDRLDGDAPIQFDRVEESDGVADVGYVEQFDDRVYVGEAYAWKGQIFSLSAAYPASRPALRATAQDALRRMQRTLSFSPL